MQQETALPKAAMNAMVLPEFADGAAFVAGGGGGIGAAITAALANAGSNVVITYKSRRVAAEQAAQATRQASRNALVAQLDLEDAQATRHLMEEAATKFGRIHSVVYAAGPPIEFRYIQEIDAGEWARVCAADVNGCFNLVSAALGQFRKQGGRALVTLVTGAVDRPPPRDILSAAPKAAIEALIRGVAREEGRFGVRANCVGPGYIEAGLGLATVQAHTQNYVERMLRAIPLKRAGKAEDVADVVCFLLSDKARYVTGETIAVAGGHQLA